MRWRTASYRNHRGRKPPLSDCYGGMGRGWRVTVKLGGIPGVVEFSNTWEVTMCSHCTATFLMCGRGDLKMAERDNTEVRYRV